MQAIPKVLKAEHSSRVQDSAFPPFKVEHKYRGVYERAGFDIYKGDNRSRHTSGSNTPKTMAHSTFSSSSGDSYKKSGKFNPYEAKRNNSQPINAYPQQKFTARNKSHGDLYSKPTEYPSNVQSSGPYPHSQTSSGPYPHSQQSDGYYPRSQSHTQIPTPPQAEKHFQPPLSAKLPVYQSFTQPNTAGSNEDLSPRNYSGSTAVSSYNDGPLVLKQDLSKVDTNSDFNFSPQSNHKNVMGLSLDLKQSNYSPTQYDGTEELSETSMDDLGQRKYEDTNNTTMKDFSQNVSVNTLELLDTPEKNKRANGTQLPSPPRTGFSSRLSGELMNFKNDFQQREIPSIEVNRFSYSNKPNDSNPLDEFENFKKAKAQESNDLNNDYQKFLNNNLEPSTHEFRKSQLSMVSSIISKESHYSDDEGESEVERELERQLESLKTGGSSELLTGMRPRPPPAVDEIAHEEIENDVEELGSEANPITFDNQTIPTITIGNESDFNDVESVESIKPLSVRHSKTHKNFELPDITQTPKQDHNPQLDAPLDNVPYPTHELDSPQVPYPYKSPEFDPVFPIGSSHEYPLETVKLDKAPPKLKYPPGSGPCRSCNQKISPNGRGLEKAIYSKTGELTGQWHRGCFKCSYENCAINFNKEVQCYVLDDEAYCNHHYHQLNNSLCESCRIGIEGECIENEITQKWHLHCLKCTKCYNNITADYYLINDTIFCEADALPIISGEALYNDNGNMTSLSTTDKIEKRRTRLMHIDS